MVGLVEYYKAGDSAYSLISSTVLPEELPIFGGFYSSGTAYYLVTGQNNPEESATVPVFRVTKYSTSWEKLGSAELKDCNTVNPFDAGSLRMDHEGKYLMIRTSHEMYQSSDGYNHQANVTIQVDTDTMEITDSYTGIMNMNYGYVSHSFNQFIKVEHNKLVTIDHGDAHPRAIVLLKYKTDISAGSFKPSYNTPCEGITALSLAGATGVNATGASVDGFELSSASYLVAVNSVVQDDTSQSRTTRNIFVSVVDKTSSAVNTQWLTNYAEGDGTTSTPQMVKLSDNRFMVLWSRSGVVYYCQIDGNGNVSGEIHSMEGSDITYGQTLEDVTLSGGSAELDSNTLVEGSYTLVDTSIQPAVSDSETTRYEILFTPNDTENYESVTGEFITITVHKALMPQDSPKEEIVVDYSYSQVGMIALPENWEWATEDWGRELTAGGPAVRATANYIGADQDNYQCVSVGVSVTRSEKYGVREDVNAPVTIVDNNELSYGETIGTLQLSNAIFGTDQVPDDNGTMEWQEVEGTLKWQNPEQVPEIGDTMAYWILPLQTVTFIWNVQAGWKSVW